MPSMSRPRAATSVAKSTVYWPPRKPSTAAVRCCCVRSAWSAAALIPKTASCRGLHSARESVPDEAGAECVGLHNDLRVPGDRHDDQRQPLGLLARRHVLDLVG